MSKEKKKPKLPALVLVRNLYDWTALGYISRSDFFVRFEGLLKELEVEAQVRAKKGR